MVLQVSLKGGAHDRSSTLHFHPVAQITGLYVDADVVGHLEPPVLVGYKLKGLKVACMSGDTCLVVLLSNMIPQFSVFEDIDLTTEHE
jgi:hypothetical protein